MEYAEDLYSDGRFGMPTANMGGRPVDAGKGDGSIVGSGGTGVGSTRGQGGTYKRTPSRMGNRISTPGGAESNGASPDHKKTDKDRHQSGGGGSGSASGSGKDNELERGGSGADLMSTTDAVRPAQSAAELAQNEKRKTMKQAQQQKDKKNAPAGSQWAATNTSSVLKFLRVSVSFEMSRLAQKV